MNQSETNPLATALAALMTGHNANPNTSLRIPLVDSNGNLQPGPTLAELASVLGGNFKTFDITNGSISAPLDIANEVLTYVRGNYTDSKVLFYGTVQAQAGSRFVYGMLYSSNYNYGTINVEMYNGTKAFFKVQSGTITLIS